MRDVGLRLEWQRTFALPVVIGVALWLVAAALAWIGEKIAWIAAGGGLPPLESSQVFVWGTTNAYPILLLLSVPFLAHLGGGARRVLAIAIGLAAVVVIPFSQGRAGWLGIVVALVAFDALSGWRTVRRVLGVGRGKGWRPFAVVAALGLLVVLALAVGDRAVGAVASNLDARWRIWEQALGIFAADPLTGSGPGTYSWIRLEHVPDYVERIGVVLAHNAVIQTLSDGGVVLLGGLAMIVAAWAGVAWRRRDAMTGNQRLAAAAVVGVGAASLLDDFSSLPAIIALAITLAAWSVPAASVAAPAAIGRRWGLVAVAIGIGLVSLWPTIAVEIATPRH